MATNMSANVSRDECERHRSEIWHVLDGNGQPGLRQVLGSLETKLAVMQGIADDREKQAVKRDRKITLLLAIIVGLVTIIGALGGIRSVQKGELDLIPRLWHNTQTPRRQEAGSSIGRVRPSGWAREAE